MRTGYSGQPKFGQWGNEEGHSGRGRFGHQKRPKKDARNPIPDRGPSVGRGLTGIMQA